MQMQGAVPVPGIHAWGGLNRASTKAHMQVHPMAVEVARAGRGLAPGALPGARPRGSKGARALEKLRLLRTSLRTNLQRYFDNSSLHGMRFIREEHRPFREKFLWFFCTTVGGVATLIIIASLWEKFQTNPTITGLDTDFHNWDVPFPAVVLCPQDFIDEDKLDALVEKEYRGEEFYHDLLHKLAMLSLNNVEDVGPILEQAAGRPLPNISLITLQEKVLRSCESILVQCAFKGPTVECCRWFRPLRTEVGVCLAFNTQHAWPAGEFQLQDILETDEALSLRMDFAPLNKNLSNVDQSIPLYLLHYDEVPSIDAQPHATFDYALQQAFFSEKHTYTTEDVRQLSLRQRRCAFADEIHLQVDSKYTFSACMLECRMRLSRSLCGCVAYFYPPTAGFRVCDVSELRCLAKNAEMLRSPLQCSCELGCDHTVYEIERLQDALEISTYLEVQFVSWPLIRYKREVLFGWVDLLVSFGGIAGLFLGFSLLSGVEVIYYFTMRACCMADRDEDELRKLQAEHERRPRPALDLSLTPYFIAASDAAAASAAQKAIAPAVLPAPSYVAPRHPHAVLRTPYVIPYVH